MKSDVISSDAFLPGGVTLDDDLVLPLTYFEDLGDKLNGGQSVGHKHTAGTEAKSKWVHEDGRQDWQPCTILASHRGGKYYLIEWKSNGKFIDFTSSHFEFFPILPSANAHL